MQKPSPVDFVFLDIAKFDTQNSIIDNLLNQIQSEKLTDEQVNQYLGNLSSNKDIQIKERLEKLRKGNSFCKENNNNNEIFRNIPSPLSPNLPDYPPAFYFPNLPTISDMSVREDDDDDDDDDNDRNDNNNFFNPRRPTIIMSKAQQILVKQSQ